MARLFGVCRTAVQTWARENSEFLSAIKRGRDKYDSEVVEKALLKRANGYQFTETTLESDKTGKMVITKLVRKQMVPDVTAQIFWLKNRNPARWRDAKYIDGSLRISHEAALAALE
ncbi:MAG: hypothetical protein RBT11_03555 [Desulfobacterales bacterium]|nr:hypothetical protein [Desulfobacterales bacterium]